MSEDEDLSYNTSETVIRRHVAQIGTPNGITDKVAESGRKGGAGKERFEFGNVGMFELSASEKCWHFTEFSGGKRAI